jgi:cytochrome c oxidase subunit II
MLSVAAALTITGMLFAPSRAGTTNFDDVPAQQIKPSPEKPPRVITVTAKDFDFDPAVIHMKVDERVELNVTSADKTHGIRITPFPDGAKTNTAPGLSFPSGEDCWKLKKGETVVIGVVPTEPGTYTFSCCKLCGSGHKKMKGQLIVDP